METATFRRQSAPRHERAARAHWARQSARNCEAVSINPALTILAAHIRSTRLLMGIATLRVRSTPRSGPTPGLRKAWQRARSCEAVSTKPALRILAAHIPGSRLGMEEATLRFQSTPYSGSVRGPGWAWLSVRSCEAASTHPALTMLAAHIPPPRLLREEASSGEQSGPRPEHAPHAIWAGQAARSCEAASTDWGRASNSGSPSPRPAVTRRPSGWPPRRGSRRRARPRPCPLPCGSCGCGTTRPRRRRASRRPAPRAA